MRLLITGGGGFAGYNICKYFSGRDNDIVATYRSAIPRSVSGIKYVQQELSEPIEIDGAFDAIIHTACSKSGAELSMQEYIRDNVDPVRSLISFARTRNIRTIIYFSTRSVYGTIHCKEVYEDYEIHDPGKYGMTKRIAELLFCEADELNTIGLRVPGLIGDGAHDIWLTDIVNKIYNSEDVEIADFETRNLVWIDDVCRFMDELIQQSVRGINFKYPVVNLSCTKTINNLDIANIIKQRLKSKSRIRAVSADNRHFWLNSDRACEMGFLPMDPKEIVSLYLDTIRAGE